MNDDRTAGERGRDEGAQRAQRHAERVHEQWAAQAYGAVQDYARIAIGTFTSEDVRRAAADYLPDQPDKRAWGAVFMRAARDGLIEHAGYRKSSSPTRHCGVVGVWRAAPPGRARG